MRDYTRFDMYLSSLYEDIYNQPEDVGHTAWAEDGIEWGLDFPGMDANTVLDVGCGTGFCCDKFEDFGLEYFGVTASIEDWRKAGKAGRNVKLGDMSYIVDEDETYDMIFARHALEHSPFPIITLMEWWRVSRKYLFLIAPAPEYWGYAGRNHYSMAHKDLLWWWLRRSGWSIIRESEFRMSDFLYMLHYSDNRKRFAKGEALVDVPGPPKLVEYRLVCEKVLPIAT